MLLERILPTKTESEIPHTRPSHESETTESDSHGEPRSPQVQKHFQLEFIAILVGPRGAGNQFRAISDSRTSDVRIKERRHNASLPPVLLYIFVDLLVHEP